MSSRGFAREFVESAGSVESFASVGSVGSMKAGGGAHAVGLMMSGP
jgi:hypothetical protein